MTKKTLFIYLHKIKLLNAAESARRAGVKVRTGQAWSARMKEDPNWNIYEKQTNQNKIGRNHIILHYPLHSQVLQCLVVFFC